MRPDLLNPLFAGAEGLKGVGPGLARPLEKLGLSRVKDIAYHLPDRFAYRRAVAGLDEASVGEQVVVALTALEYRSSGSARAPFRVMASDEAGTICAPKATPRPCRRRKSPRACWRKATCSRRRR